MNYNRIQVAFGALKKITGPTISYQYDVQQILVINGLNLPEYYEVDFCNEGDTYTETIVGMSDGVSIPNKFLRTGKKVKAYLVLTGDGDVQTRYEITLPVNARPQRQDIDPTDDERLEIDRLVAALNDGVSRAEDAAAMLENVSAEAETLDSGADASAEYDDGVFRFGIPKGPKGDKMTYADLTEADKLDLIQGPIAEAQADAEQAVEEKGEEVIASIPEDYTTTVNALKYTDKSLSLINKEDFEKGGLYNATGLPYSGLHFRTKDFIPVSGHVFVVCSSLSQVGDRGSVNLYWYDENEEFISVFETGRFVGVNEYIPPAEAVYFKAMVSSPTQNPGVFDGECIYHGNQVTNYLPKAFANGWIENGSVWRSSGSLRGFPADPKYVRAKLTIDADADYIVTVPSGIQCYIIDSSELSTVATLASGISKTSLTSGTYYIIFKKSNNNDITVSDVDGFEIKQIKDVDLTGENRHGVYKASLPFAHGYYFDADGTLATAAYYHTTEIFPMPESGLRISKITDTSSVYYLAVFWEKENAEFTIADYPYKQTTLTSGTLFFPYQAGLYCSISASVPANVDTAAQFDITYGRVKDTGGKLTNLAPINITGSSGAEVPSFSAFAKAATGTGNYDSTVYSRCYGSVIRMQDADRVVCSTEYNMIAWVYNSSNTIVQRLRGSRMSATDIGGFNELDFSAYNDGYAVIAIWSPVMLVNDARTYTGMGFLARYDDVLNNVFVEYKNGTAVSRMQYMYPAIADNLRIIKGLKQGEFLGGEINDVYNYHFTMPQMDEVSASPYNGKGIANELFCQVTMKSYITSLKNKNSRIYNQMPKDLVPGETSTYGTFGYGSVCNSLAAFVTGIHYITRTSMFAVEHNVPGFTTVAEDFNFNRDIAMLMPGDWLVTSTIDGGHVMVVTDVVQVNGVPHCVELIEAYMPFVRFRYAFFDPSLSSINTQFQSRPFTDYNILLRPDYETIKAIRSDAYMSGLETDYTVGKVMCDRGSDSVYAKDNRFCYLTIADDNIDTVYLYKDNEVSPFATVTVPADAPTQISDYRVIDVKSDLADNYGVITVKTNLDAETVEERFLYAEPKPKLTSTVSGNVRTLNLTDVDNIAMVLVKYKYPLSGTEQYAARVTHVPSEITRTGDTTGTIDIPNSYTKEIDGANVTLGFVFFSVVYKTDCGTFVQTGSTSMDNICDSDAVAYA